MTFQGLLAPLMSVLLLNPEKTWNLNFFQKIWKRLTVSNKYFPVQSRIALEGLLEIKDLNLLKSLKVLDLLGMEPCLLVGRGRHED